MKEIKIGLLGTGFMGKMHAESYKRIKGAKLVAVCGRSNLQSFAKEYCARAYFDLDEMLEKEDLDVVDICLPSFLHKEVALKAMDKVKYLFLEKPVALTDVDGQQLLEKQKESGARVQVGHVLRFEREYLYLKKCVDENLFGKVLNATFTRLSPSPSWGKGWQTDVSKSGGALVDLFIHDADICLWLFGNPENAKAMVNKLGEKNSYVSAHLEYNDFVVNVVGSWQLPQSFPFSAGFRVVFEKGVVELKENILTVYDSQKSYIPKLPKKLEMKTDAGGNISDLGGYYTELEYFIDKVQNEKDVERCTLSDGVKALEFVCEFL